MPFLFARPLGGPPVLAPRMEVTPAPAATTDAPDHAGDQEIVDVTVRGHRTPPPRATSDFVIDRAVLTAAPHQSAGDLLAAAPGVFVTKPEGEAVAHQIFLRGFDAEHGQDMEINVGPVPVNQPSHIHGQGYADLGFIIPEVVRSLRVTEGVYDPRQGDFAVAGSVDFDLGVTDRGYRLRSSWGSFQTFRQTAIFAPPGEAEETFGAVSFQRSRGFGQNRGAQSASAMGQLAFRGPAGWTGLLHTAAHGARANLAGVLRADDIAAGVVGFTDSYPDPSANAQSALGTRGQLALTAEHAGDNGSRTILAVYLIAANFRIRENFTGYLQRSRERLDWIGRGDLIEQANQAVTFGGRMEHRTGRFAPAPFADGLMTFGLSFRSDATDQIQNLIKAPQNETWDHRIDATIHGMNMGAFVDADVRLGRLVKLRGGYRADALVTDVDDRLGNFAPLFQRQTHFLGFRRTALGVAAGPRAAVELAATRWLTGMVSYGEGYRSPQAVQLEEGESAPYAKVRSAEIGARARSAGDRLNLSVAGFLTRLSQDLAFDPEEGSLTKIGPTTRTGLVAHLLTRPWRFALASVSVTSVRATLDAPPPPTAAQPTPPYRAGERLPYVPPLVVRGDLALVGRWSRGAAAPSSVP
ncbi:MAG: TonB-dependent receptor, partial [Pseudomonadota bacterium]